MMPQMHRELQNHIMLQAGAGCRLAREATNPETAFRLTLAQCEQKNLPDRNLGGFKKPAIPTFALLELSSALKA